MSDLRNGNFLFIHVMKTGGTSLADIIASNFNDTERYPEASLLPFAEAALQMEAYTHVPRLVEVANAQRPPYRLIRGHVPYAVRSLLNDSFNVITLLRHPVDRTLSYLKHSRKFHVEHQGKSLEDIYTDEWFFKSFIENYQTKLFSMTAAECLAQTRLGDHWPPLPPRDQFEQDKPFPPDAQQLHASGGARFALELFSPATAVIQADEHRLATAKANLGEVELVGTTGNYSSFLSALKERFDWTVPKMPQKNVGDGSSVSREFREQIAHDNRIDLDLYEYATRLSE